jgi:hypothetical protein
VAGSFPTSLPPSLRARALKGDTEAYRSDRPFEWWQTTFRESIAAIGTVVLVLAP